MVYDLYVPGLPGPANTYQSVDLPSPPSVGEYLTVGEAPYCVRVTHVPRDLDHGIEVTDRL